MTHRGAEGWRANNVYRGEKREIRSVNTSVRVFFHFNHNCIKYDLAFDVFQTLGLYGGGTWGSVKTLLGAGVGGLGPFPCRENEPFWKMPHKGKISVSYDNVYIFKLRVQTISFCIHKRLGTVVRVAVQLRFKAIRLGKQFIINFIDFIFTVLVFPAKSSTKWGKN